MTKEELDELEIKELAGQIRSEKQFKKILLAARPSMRQLVYERIAELEIKELAGQIRSEKQFKKILLAARPSMRQLVYERIAPHLTFKPRVFRMLMRH